MESLGLEEKQSASYISKTQRLVFKGPVRLTHVRCRFSGWMEFAKQGRLSGTRPHCIYLWACSPQPRRRQHRFGRPEDLSVLLHEPVLSLERVARGRRRGAGSERRWVLQAQGSQGLHQGAGDIVQALKLTRLVHHAARTLAAMTEEKPKLKFGSHLDPHCFNLQFLSVSRLGSFEFYTFWMTFARQQRHRFSKSTKGPKLIESKSFSFSEKAPWENTKKIQFSRGLCQFKRIKNNNWMVMVKVFTRCRLSRSLGCETSRNRTAGPPD